MYQEKKLRSMSARVIIRDNVTKLISYQTPVVMIVNGILIFSKDWQCSVTTIKHVKAFIEDYFPYAKTKYYNDYGRLSLDALRKAVKSGKIGIINNL